MDREMEDLVHEHMNVAHSIATRVWRSAPHALEMDELRSIAYLGLVDAVRRWPDYCAERGFDKNRLEYFRTFASRRVHGAVMDSLRSSDWATRSLRTKGRQLTAAGLGSGATAAELAEKTGMTVRAVLDTIRDLAARPVSLDAEAVDVAGSGGVESARAERQLLGVVGKAVLELAEVCQTVLALHYYLGVELKEIARVLELPDSLVGQLHTEAVLAVHGALLESVGAVPVD